MQLTLLKLHGLTSWHNMNAMLDASKCRSSDVRGSLHHARNTAQHSADPWRCRSAISLVDLSSGESRVFHILQFTNELSIDHITTATTNILVCDCLKNRRRVTEGRVAISFELLASYYSIHFERRMMHESGIMAQAGYPQKEGIGGSGLSGSR